MKRNTLLYTSIGHSLGRPTETNQRSSLQMAPNKRPGERWFKEAPEAIWQEHETPKDDSYVPKEGTVMAWSFLVVKTSQYKIVFVVKVGTPEQNGWTTLSGWEVASVVGLGEYIDVVLENSAVQNVHMFMHEIAEPFDPEHVKETCIDPDVIKPESIFIDASISGTKVASRFTKLKIAVNAINKTQQSKSKSQQPVRRKATTEEGAGSSRPQTVRKPRPVPTDSRRTTPTATPADSEAPSPSNSRQTTPSKRRRESGSVLTDDPVSPEVRMPKPGDPVKPTEIQKIVTAFWNKCGHCFFMGQDFKFEVDISQCHLAPPEKCVRAKEEDYVDWLCTQIMCEQYKDDRQTLVLMPQGQKRMPTPDMWPTIKKGDFWLIDGQHSVCAAKKIQGMVEWDDPNNQKEKLKTWKALVVWSEDDTKLVDISRFFNMGNKTKAYQASWARNIMASRVIWNFYERPERERENAKDKNPNWEVSITFIFESFSLLYCFHSLGRPTQTRNTIVSNPR